MRALDALAGVVAEGFGVEGEGALRVRAHCGTAIAAERRVAAVDGRGGGRRDRSRSGNGVEPGNQGTVEPAAPELHGLAVPRRGQVDLEVDRRGGRILSADGAAHQAELWPAVRGVGGRQRAAVDVRAPRRKGELTSRNLGPGEGGATLRGGLDEVGARPA